MQTIKTKNGLVDMGHPVDEEQDVRGMIDSAKCASEECVTNHPVASTLVALGAGAFFGLVIGATMSRREAEKRENYFAKMGSQLANSIGSSVPDSLNWRR